MIRLGVRANSSLAGGEPTRPGKGAALAVPDLMTLSFSWFLSHLIRRNRRGKRHFRSGAVAVPQRIVL